MKLLLSIDFIIWKYFVPTINMNLFKSKMMSVLALVYISFYRLPRKYLLHYLRGKGKVMVVNTQDLLIENPIVFSKLIREISKAESQGLKKGQLPISQTEVHNPQYKYSLGSFVVDYSLQDRRASISVHSNYHYAENNDRLTKYLHHWLYSFKQKGKVHDFEVEGKPVLVSVNDLKLPSISPAYKRLSTLSYLLV